MKKPNDPKKITQAQLLQAVSDANKTSSCVTYGFILGAGASVSSGIPAGVFFADRWHKKIKEDIGTDALKTWQDSIEDFDEDNLAASYTKLFAKRFEVDYSLGYEELQRHMSNAKPSIGYSFLAQVLAKTKNKFIITTNFDTMSEDALFDIKDAKPLVLGHEVLSTFVNAASPTRPTIIKIHRDFLFDPYNTDDKINKMDEQWQKALRPVLLENSMIVIGYGGNDESLMNYLKEIKDRKPIYWCCRDADKLSTNIKNLLSKNDYLVKIDSFDKFMLMLSDKLKFDALIDKDNIKESQIVKDAIARAEAYSKQLEELTKEDLDGEEQKAIKKLLPSWWDYELAVQGETDNDQKDKLYQDGVKAHPKSHELMGNYALFLHQTHKDYDKAEEFYLKAFALEPDKATNNGNYALFLEDICKDYDKAEEFYLKALALEPNQATNTGNYAFFLWDIRKDYNKAEEFYQKTLALEPNQVNNNENYAHFLNDIRKDYDKAEEYLLKALKLEPDHAVFNENYAIFLKDIRKDYDKAEEFYLKALALEPDHAVFNGNYAIFLKDIHKDYDKAEEFYLKALSLEPNHANVNGNYAIFLKDIRKDYDKAEEFYLKALALEPDNANINGNYAQFLLITGRKPEADKYIKTAFANMDTDNTDLALELWFYRLAHYPEFFEQAKKELDRLLAEGHKSLHWNLQDNIKQAEIEGFKDIPLLKDYAKKITQE